MTLREYQISARERFYKQRQMTFRMFTLEAKQIWWNDTLQIHYLMRQKNPRCGLLVLCSGNEIAERAGKDVEKRKEC